MSANIRPKTLHDLHKWDADLLILCRQCGRAGVFQLVPILTHFHSKGWNTDWGCVASRFKCRGCGSKDVAARMALQPRAQCCPICS